MPEGKLILNVFDETVGKPIPNAKITISSSENPENIIEELLTNDSGQSDVINLTTPPLEYSLSPNSPMPYGEYDVKINNPGFDNITIQKIQILPGTISEQDIFMQPTLQDNVQNLNYSISQHTLYGEYPPKISESAVKELPNPSGFVVLNKVVVPEYIIVHDGNPDDNTAPNYWIPYKDYIKNVCSSEIYATWPEAAIRANVLTIVSFTLNRVYTEWYRSRGKNFTVTSTTAYDQKFIYQRNVFSEISQIVDELFATYITKPNIQQPLFTQYCDGKNVTCPEWLSQWGSKEMAENGSNYIDILRFYYGSDIYLETTNQVMGIPVSFPGEIIETGSQGEVVRTIQRQLNAINKNYPAIQRVAVDGVYGSNTTDSVKKFQEIFGLPQTGIVDYSTWYEISKIYIAVERLA